MSAGKSQDAATAKRSGCLRRRSCSADAGLREADQPVLLVSRVRRAATREFCVTQGTRSLVMKVSYWRFGSLGLSAYQGSMANDGSMIVRLYWFLCVEAAQGLESVAVERSQLRLNREDVEEVVGDAGRRIGRGQDPEDVRAVSVVGGVDVVRRDAVGVGAAVLDLRRRRRRTATLACRRPSCRRWRRRRS